MAQPMTMLVVVTLGVRVVLVCHCLECLDQPNIVGTP